MILYLDDWRQPPKGENIASADNYADFIALLDKYKNCLELVDLDYDLGYDSMYNGYHVLKYMKQFGIEPECINVHSTHPVGRNIMLEYAKVNFPNSEVK